MKHLQPAATHPARLTGTASPPERAPQEKHKDPIGTTISGNAVTLDEAYEAFLSILEANGMTVVPHGRFLKIVDSGGRVDRFKKRFGNRGAKR